MVQGKNAPGTGRRRAALRSLAVAGVWGGMALFAALGRAPDAAAAELLARWPLDEGVGQVAADVSGHEHHARLGSLPAADPNEPAWVSGRFGSALRFVGAQNQYAKISRPATLAPQHITLETWIRRLGTPGRWRYVISTGGRGCESASFGLYSASSGGLGFYVSDDNAYVVSPGAEPGAVWDGAWHHAVGTYDGRAVRLYLDGSEIGHGSPTQLVVGYGLSSPDAFLGSYHGTCDLPFTGDVDEVAVRDQALGAAEIAALNQGATARPAPPQVPPVAGPPAQAPEKGTTPPAQDRCLTVRVRPGLLRVRRRARLRISVRRGGRAVEGVRVTVRGSGVSASIRTRRNGRAHVHVRSRRTGRLRVRIPGQPRSCSVPHVKVLRQGR
jgi:hypothetical protein